MLDPDHRELMERAACLPVNMARGLAMGLRCEADRVVVWPAHPGDGPHPRTGAPPLTERQLQRAAAIAHVWLGTSAGDLVRLEDGSRYVFRRPEDGPVRV